MTAYVVYIRDETFDQAEMDTYVAKVVADVKGHPMTPLAYGDCEVLEGAPIENVVIVSFPTVEDAKAWYNSPEYQAAAQHRFRGAKGRAFIVPGM